MAPTSLPQLVSPAAIKSIASSGITHVALLSALAGWSISAALQLPSFPGQPVATQIELILLELEQLPTAVEFSAPEPQVLIMPHRAELAGQVFVDTLDWHTELDVELDADLLRRVVAAENAAARRRRSRKIHPRRGPANEWHPTWPGIARRVTRTLPAKEGGRVRSSCN